ncbi:MAG: response regulator [Flavitalea sp.]
MSELNKQKVIVLADDDIDDQDLLKEAFHMIAPDIEVKTAFSGKEVLQVLETFGNGTVPFLIILDFNMPDFNGAEVLKKICIESKYQEVPKIVWSTSDSPLYQQLCKESGADHYFKKPLSYADVLKQARELIDLGQSKSDGQNGN